MSAGIAAGSISSVLFTAVLTISPYTEQPLTAINGQAIHYLQDENTIIDLLQEYIATVYSHLPASFDSPRFRLRVYFLENE